MKLYVDTSALVKYFHDEPGTDVVRETMADTAVQAIWVSDLVRIEFVSAIQRRVRCGELSDSSADEALQGFESELTRFSVEPVNTVVLDDARRLLLEHGRERGLRSLDSIHLATYNLLYEDDWVFVAADERLCHIARLLGWRFLNPLRTSS